MHETSGFVTIAVVAILGAMSPGPNIVVVTKNSLTYSRKTGIYTAFGVSLGVFVHIAYCLISLSFFIAQSALFFNIYIPASSIEIVQENDLRFNLYKSSAKRTYRHGLYQLNLKKLKKLNDINDIIVTGRCFKGGVLYV